MSTRSGRVKRIQKDEVNDPKRGTAVENDPNLEQEERSNLRSVQTISKTVANHHVHSHRRRDSARVVTGDINEKVRERNSSKEKQKAPERKNLDKRDEINVNVNDNLLSRRTVTPKKNVVKRQSDRTSNNMSSTTTNNDDVDLEPIVEIYSASKNLKKKKLEKLHNNIGSTLINSGERDNESVLEPLVKHYPGPKVKGHYKEVNITLRDRPSSEESDENYVSKNDKRIINRNSKKPIEVIADVNQELDINSKAINYPLENHEKTSIQNECSSAPSEIVSETTVCVDDFKDEGGVSDHSSVSSSYKKKTRGSKSRTIHKKKKKFNIGQRTKKAQTKQKPETNMKAVEKKRMKSVTIIDDNIKTEKRLFRMPRTVPKKHRTIFFTAPDWKVTLPITHTYLPLYTDSSQ